MAWTAPKTWVTNELVTADLLNAHLRDNLSYLKAPPAGTNFLPLATYTLSSTSFADIDATNLNFSITTTGGRLLIGFFARMNIISTAVTASFTFSIGGTTFFTSDGMYSGLTNAPVCFTYLSAPWTPTSNLVIKPQYKVSSGSFTLLYPSAWVVEV